MSDSGHNQHITKITNLDRAFIIGIVINLVYVIIEFIGGFYYNSLSLISDAGHNLIDVTSLALALLAYRLSKVKSNEKFTYGYRKSTILVSLVNSIILFIVIGGVLWESIERVNNPVKVEGIPISIFAAIGVLINVFSALLFFKGKDIDLNVKGAYLHLMSDAGVSLGVLFSGLFIYWFQIYWFDVLTSFIIVVVIFYSTWSLFRDSLFLTLDGVPKEIDYNKVISLIKEDEEVVGVHHVHIWALSTLQNAMTAHIIVSEDVSFEQLGILKNRIKNKLNSINIRHVTIEFETEKEYCKEC